MSKYKKRVFYQDLHADLQKERRQQRERERGESVRQALCLGAHAQRPAVIAGESQAGIVPLPFGFCEICTSRTRLQACPCQTGVNSLTGVDSLSSALNTKPQQESIFTSIQLLTGTQQAKQLWQITNSTPCRAFVVTQPLAHAYQYIPARGWLPQLEEALFPAPT